jgi:quercetin dioxygenase-like cupin family protein
MIKKSNDYELSLKENMRGGDGTVKITGLLTKEELNEKGRLFGVIRLEPGCSIGYHIHEGESEIFHVLCGSALYNDNGTEITINAGDTTVTKPGEGHSIKNPSADTVCEVMALIVYA